VLHGVKIGKTVDDLNKTALGIAAYTGPGPNACRRMSGKPGRRQRPYAVYFIDTGTTTC